MYFLVYPHVKSSLAVAYVVEFLFLFSLFFFFFCLRLLAKFAQLFFFCRSLCIRNKSMRGLEFSQSTMGLYVQVFCTFQAPSAISMFPLQPHPPPVFRPRYMCVPLPVWSMCFSLSTSLSVQIIIPVRSANTH